MSSSLLIPAGLCLAAVGAAGRAALSSAYLRAAARAARAAW